jgi:hypothetical protein
LPSSQNASVTVTLASDSPGAVYCIAMSKGNVPKSIDALKSGGIVKQYQTLGNVTITVMIPLLSALKAYQAFCYAQSSGGFGNSYADVLSTKQFFTTSCCHEIAFTNSPTSVYGDISLYSSSSSLSYMFSYSLSTAPFQGSIIVTPHFAYTDGTIITDILAIPSSSSFLTSSSASKLSGQFILSTNISGAVLVSLVVTGQDRENYSAASTSVGILSANESLPAPNLLSCVFDSSGGYFVATFDSSTDQAGIMASSWSCDQVLTFANADTALCTWTSLFSIKGTFDALTASLQPGDTLSVKSGLLRAACRTGTVCSQNPVLQLNGIFTHNIKKDISQRMTSVTRGLSVIVQQPLTPIIPKLVLSIPLETGACSNLTVDLSLSSGSGGRPWANITWTIMSTNGDPSAVLSYLDSEYDYSANIVTIPRSLLTSATYAISVAVTNFLGAFASEYSTVRLGLGFWLGFESVNFILSLSLILTLTCNPNTKPNLNLNPNRLLECLVMRICP